MEAMHGIDFEGRQALAHNPAMIEHGYPRTAILDIMGGNHVRTAAEVWK